MPDATYLPLISFFRRLIITMSITSKRIQVMHLNKGSDKIVIVQSMHNTVTGLMTHNKAKLTSSLSRKQTSEFACSLKPVRTCDEHQPFINLASPGTKSHSPCSRGKLPSALKDFGDKSPCSITNANSSTNSHSGSAIKMSNDENYSNCSNSFTSFSMTMPIMAASTTSVKEQLAEMVGIIAKLTKMVEEKDM